MLGVGVGIGVSNIRRDLPIPNKSDIIRYFKTQEDNTLIDKFGNDGDKILPVSVFDGVDGVVGTFIPNTDTFSFSCKLKFNSFGVSDNNAIYAITSTTSNTPICWLITNGNKLKISYRTFTVPLVEAIGSTNLQANVEYSIRFESTSGNINAYINDVEEISITPSGFENSAFSAANIGASQRTATDRYFDGIIWDVTINDTFIPLPHLPYGFDSSNNPIPLTVSGGVSLGYDINGSSYLQDKGVVVKSNGDIIPNTPTGQAAYPIVSGDTFIAGGGMMNLTDCLVRLYEVGDTDPAKLFFDLSNTLIWNDRARQDYYDTNNTGDIHTSILKQAELYLTFEAAYKYRLWSKINSNGVFKDIFLYANQLQGENICLAKRYVGVGEIYTTIEDDTLICRNDIIE